MEKAKIKLLIADDHPVVLNGLVSIFADYDEIQVIGTATNGEEVLAFIQNATPDVLLLDIEMPVLGGLDTLKRLKSMQSDIRVIAFTIYSGKDLYDMLDAGVDGYLLKSTGIEEMIDAIKKVSAGENYFSKSLTIQLQNHSKINLELGKVQLLSSRELEILTLIAFGNNANEIAEMLHISKLTVHSHRKNCMEKLGISRIAGLVRFAIENNLLK